MRLCAILECRPEPMRNASASLTSSRWMGGALLSLSLAAGTGIRAWLSLHDDGIYWPDEIYQSLEPAHRLAFGYGMIAWEFVEGARSWLLPGALAGLLKVSAQLGLDSPREYLWLVRLLFSARSLLAGFGSYRLASAYRAPFLPATLAASLCALAAPLIYFAPRAMSENASAAAVVWGLALVLHPDSRHTGRISGSSLLALAVLLRFQNVVFCLGALGFLAAIRILRVSGEVMVVIYAWAFLIRLLECIPWSELRRISLTHHSL